MRGAVTAILVCMLPIAAAAQEPSAWVGADAAQNSGPMIVQRTHTTFLIAPDYKFTRVDHRDASIAGVYGGVVLDEQWFVGGGGYWQANGSHDRNLGYGGVIVGWMTPADRAIGFSARSLIGWGEARLTDTVSLPALVYPPGFGFTGDRYFPGCPTTGRPMPPCGPLPPPRGFNVGFHQGFFVAEPQADVMFRVANWGRIDAGVGYRAVGDAYHTESRLRGATASVSFQVGNF